MRKFDLSGAAGIIEDPMTFIKMVQSDLGKKTLCLDADMVCGREHIESAVMHAERAFNYGTNSSDSFAVEVMLYASGERQLSKAMAKMGVKKGDVNVVIVSFEGDSTDDMVVRWGLRPEPRAAAFSVAKAMNFGIGRTEASSVPSDMLQDLVLERVAFVDVIKR
ncbi:MAG: KEOPS complex subunit Cgi121 [Methanomassiliicoccales archaeon]|jgi:KEOPS complex subunit Cgi121